MTVEVKFRRPLPADPAKYYRYAGSPPEPPKVDSRAIYGEHVKTRKSMVRFLTKITRSVSDGGKVKAPCPDNLKDELYEAMKITASTPEPVEVEADDG